MRRRHTRPTRARHWTWVGSFSGWVTTTGRLKFPSLRRHEEPFSKRRDGRDRRAERLHKLRSREQTLCSRERDDGYFPLGT